MTKRKHSTLYRHMERLQAGRPWGTLLDAGTGLNSLGWIADLKTDRWTAITAAHGMVDSMRKLIDARKRPQDRVIKGNWADPDLLKGEQYDTVIADYLLGAVEGFVPYFQPHLFARLRPLVRGTLYVTGLEPYVPTERPETEAGRIIWEIGRFRDACLLLTGYMPYREYPAHWVVYMLKRSGFEVREAKHFKIGYKEWFVNSQINLVAAGLEALADRALAKTLHDRGEALRAEALDMISAQGALRHCRNYVIAATPV